MAREYKESQVQEACIAWVRKTYPRLILFHVNNNASSARKGAQLKRLGVMAGVPDLFMAMGSPDYLGLFIELKKAGQKPSAIQKALHEELRLQGYRVEIIYTLDAFKALVRGYLTGLTKD